MPGMIQLDGSPVSHSPVTQSSRSSPLQSFSSLSLSPLSNAISTQHTSPAPLQHPWVQELKSEERGLLIIQLLLRCANYVACGHMEYTNLCLEQLSLLASLTGDPMQRVATYFMEGLAARITKSWPGLYKALNCTHLPSVSDLLSARQVFFNLCPYLKFAFTIVNQCILDAMEGERVVHIIDLGASEAIQWVALLQTLSTRAGGPPHLRITIINERKEVLDHMGQRLSEEAEKLDIPFQFHPVVTKLENLDAEMLRVKTGEAVAVSSVLQLHSLLSEEEGGWGRGPNGVGQSGSSAGGSLQGHHGPSHAAEDLGLLARERSPYSGIASRFMQGDQGSHFQQYFDERGVKRNREETTTIASRESEVFRSMYGNNGANCSNNGDRTLRELLENEGNDNANARTKHSIQLELSSPSGREGSSPSTSNYTCAADRMLRMLRSLSPKVMVVMEQESDHNSPNLVDRFVEALHYYSAMLDSLESTLPQKFSGERLTLEKHLFGREIHNIVACEGGERVERHEKLEKWRKRAEWAGFSQVPLSFSAMVQVKRLLLSYSSEGHRLVEDRGSLTVCWQERPLFSASAWQA